MRPACKNRVDGIGKLAKVVALLLAVVLVFAACAPVENEGTGGNITDSPSVETDHEQILKTATDSLRQDLEAGLREGSIASYEILEATYVDPSDEKSRDFPGSDTVVCNVEVNFRIRLGARPDKGLAEFHRRSLVEQGADGSYGEQDDSVKFFVDGVEPVEPDDHLNPAEQLDGLNFVPVCHEYQAKVDKKDVEGLSPEDVALLLFRQWMDSLQTWGDNTFYIPEYKNVSVSLDTPHENDVIGIYPDTYTYPDAVNTWDVHDTCDFRVIGVARGDEYVDGPVYYGGATFGNDGMWRENISSFGSRSFFVLTEWEDCYTLANMYYCKKEIEATAVQNPTT